jgi:hypothetical protein
MAAKMTAWSGLAASSNPNPAHPARTLRNLIASLAAASTCSNIELLSFCRSLSNCPPLPLKSPSHCRRVTFSLIPLSLHGRVVGASSHRRRGCFSPLPFLVENVVRQQRQAPHAGHEQFLINKHISVPVHVHIFAPHLVFANPLHAGKLSRMRLLCRRCVEPNLPATEREVFCVGKCERKVYTKLEAT